MGNEENETIVLENEKIQAAKPYSQQYADEMGIVNCESIEVELIYNPAFRMKYSPSFSGTDTVRSRRLQLNRTRYEDFILANRMLGNINYRGRSRAGYTLHHCYELNMTQDCNYNMQEVPRKVHRATCPHLGAYAQARKRGFRMGYSSDFLNEFQSVVSKGDDFHFGNEYFTKQFELLSQKTGVKFSKQLIAFYNKMGKTGVPSCDILIKEKGRSDYLDLAWLCPLDFEDENGIYQIMQEKTSPIQGWFARQQGNERNVGNKFCYVEFAESTNGDIYYIMMDNMEYFYYDNIIVYEHEEDNCRKVAEDLEELQDILIFNN